MRTGHTCPTCGSTNVTRSQRRGIQEAVALKHEGLSPYRCGDCDARFIQPSLHRRSRSHSWASALGIRDAKQRRRFRRLALTAVLTLLAVVVAYLLFEYFTRPVPPVDAAWRLDELDPRGVAGRRLQPRIPGDEWSVEGLREREIRRVVRGDVRP